GRGEGAGDAGGQPGEQLGLHGDGRPGVEPEGVGGAAGAGAPPVGGAAPGGEAVAVADGVLDVLCGLDPGAVPGRADEPADHLPAAAWEPVAGRVPSPGGAVARGPAVLTARPLKPGSGRPGPGRPRTDERRWDDGQARAGRSEPGAADPDRRGSVPRRGHPPVGLEAHITLVFGLVLNEA